MNATSEEAIALVEDFRGRFQGMGYGDGHYILACHAAFPVAFTPDMLYQIWANFKQYPAFASLPGRHRRIDPIAVSDLLLSGLCRPAALDIFEMDNEVRAYLLQKLREDRRFGEPRVLALANVLLQYWKSRPLAQYPESYKQTIYWTALATLDPADAARKISAALSAIREEQASEVFRMSNLLEAFSAQQPNFGNMAAYLKGMKAAILDMPRAMQEQVDRSGAFIIQEDPDAGEPVYRMPLLRQMKGKVKVRRASPAGAGKKPAAGKQHLGEVRFEQERGWVLNRGLIHGISAYALLEITVDEKQAVFPAFDRLGSEESVLRIDAEDLLDKTKKYSCRAAFQLGIMIRNEEGEEGLERRITDALAAFGGLIRLAVSEAEADYVLHVRYGLLYIAASYEPYYPRVDPVPLEGDGSGAIETAVRYLYHITRWEYIKALKNKSGQLPEGTDSPIRINIRYQVGEAWKLYPYTEKGAAIDAMEWVENRQSYRSSLQVELINESDRDLYCSLFYLSINFESSGALMEKTVEHIRAGETISVFSHKGGVLPFLIEQQILDFNQPESQAWFKVLYSEQPFDPDALALEALPPPSSEMPSKTRGFELNDKDYGPGRFRGCSAQLIPLAFKNPRYNQAGEERLLRLLGSARLAPFAAAQYLAPDGLSGRLILRPGIQMAEETPGGPIPLPEGSHENILPKIAGAYHKSVRLADFERRAERYPSRPLVVAVGDAWFRNPSIQDIAGHLSRRFNVYAAGETRRVLVTKEILREAESLEQRRAPRRVAFFLLSGGGHELLVENFRGFLNAYEGVEALPAGERPERFLLPSFSEELEAVMNGYEQAFSQLQSQYPHIRVLVHGYDYFLPQKEGEAGGTWLGQPLTEKGILQPEDRAAILKFMIDQFNARLANAAQGYPQVTYVDLRGTIRAGQWANELYPGSAGFRSIAGRLEQVIDRVLRGGSYDEPLRQQETQAAVPGIEEHLAKAIDNVRAAFETEEPPPGQQLETLADSLKELAPEMEDLHILEPLFEDGGDAALFSAAILLEARKDTSYLERLIANIDKEPLTDEVHLRLLQAVGNIISEHTPEDEQRQDLIARLREAAQQRGAEGTLPFPPGTSLDMIRQICDKAEPKIGYEEVFSDRQLGRQEAPDAEPGRGKNYLLVIGIDQYQDFPPLRNAVKDAQEIAKVLVEKYQFERENVFTLFNSAATQRAIVEQFRRLAETATEEDSLLVYHSGHGEYDKRIDAGYWIPADARRGEIGSYISFDLITRLLRAIRSRHTFIISDSAHSGSFFTSKAPTVPEPSESLPSRWLLTAGRNEVVADGWQGENSPFAQAVLQHLQRNKEPRLRVSDFCSSVTLAVGNNASELPRFGPLQGIGHQGGEFMFRLKAYKDVAFEEPPEEKAEDIEVETKTEESKPEKEYAPLRTLDDVRNRLKNHIRENEFEETFELFDQVIADRSSRENDIIMQRSQYSGIAKQIQNNLVDPNFATVTLNRIRYALSSIADDLEEEDLRPEVLQPESTEPGKSSEGMELDELERRGLEQQADILARKLSYFRQELTKAYDAGQKFALEEQIGETERQLTEIKAKLSTKSKRGFVKTSERELPPKPNRMNVSPAIYKLGNTCSRWLLTSGRKESISDEKERELSPFTKAVIGHLNDNEDPYLLVSEFINKVVINVSNNNEQVPIGGAIQSVGDEGGQFFFRLKEQEELLYQDTAFPQGKHYLFVAAIDLYQDNKIPRLQRAVHDAETVLKILIDKYQFDESNLFTLFNKQATQSAIIDQFKNLAKTRNENDILLMYFSGHGEYDKEIDVGYWLPADARLGEIGSYLSFDLVTRLVRTIRSRHTFIISDAAYSGSFFTTHR